MFIHHIVEEAHAAYKEDRASGLWFVGFLLIGLAIQSIIWPVELYFWFKRK